MTNSQKASKTTESKGDRSDGARSPGAEVEGAAALRAVVMKGLSEGVVISLVSVWWPWVSRKMRAKLITHNFLVAEESGRCD